MARSYGTRIEAVMGQAACLADLGEALGAGLFAREVDYLVAEEWAMSVTDVLDRRTKLGIHGGEALARRVGEYLAAKAAG